MKITLHSLLLGAFALVAAVMMSCAPSVAAESSEAAAAGRSGGQGEASDGSGPACRCARHGGDRPRGRMGGQGKMSSGAGRPGMRRPGGPVLNAPMEMLAKRLSLRDEQVAALEEVRARYTRETETDWQSVEEVRAKLRALWTSGEVPNKEDIIVLQSQMRGYRVKIAGAMVDARIAAIEVLDPEQRRSAGPYSSP